LASFALLWGASHVILAKDSTINRVTIVYTNDTLGSLKPCGCGGRNTGGLPRRSTYIKSVLAENPNTIIVESGDLAFAVNPSEPTAQLEAVVDCLKSMGYTAVGVGPVDLRLGEDYYKVLSKKGLPVVHIDQTKRDGVQSYILKKVGGVNVGIVSFGAVVPEKRDDFELMKERYRVFTNTRKSCSVLILLDQGNVATDEW
jgi:2',3'-cyclic-nucleotide 2'-phosphodiesterase (5'-nucleotidase family)